MSTLVTGCAGFIGSALVDKLISKTQIIGVDNFDPYYSKQIKLNNMKNFINNPNFIFYDEDICNVRKVFEENKIDAVIHLAAKPGVRPSFKNPQEYVRVNIGGTVNLLQCMREYNVNKLVFGSSSSVYGDCTAEVFNESIAGLQTISPYGQTKKTCEEFIKLYSEHFGINAVCLRFFTVYGPRQRPDLAIHKFATAIMNDEEITLFGDGTNYRDYTFIDDVTDAIVAAIDYDKTPYEIINIGSNTPICLNTLVEYLEQETGKKAKIRFTQRFEGDVMNTCADITKAQKLLGYCVKTSFKEGLHKFIELF